MVKNCCWEVSRCWEFTENTHTHTHPSMRHVSKLNSIRKKNWQAAPLYFSFKKSILIFNSVQWYIALFGKTDFLILLFKFSTGLSSQGKIISSGKILALQIHKAAQFSDITHVFVTLLIQGFLPAKLPIYQLTVLKRNLQDTLN